MIFRKKLKLTDYLEGPFLDALLDKGMFRQEGFYETFGAALEASLSRGPSSGTQTPSRVAIDRDRFIVDFIGAYLWLLKFRTLSSNRSSPRKLAFLDLLFDMEMPGFIKEHLEAYDTDRIEEVYNLMDIRCKEAYTGELPRGEPPPFLVSPIWEKGAEPHPFNVAAKIFPQLAGLEAMGEVETSINDRFTQELSLRFAQMTAPLEKVSSGVNFSWSAPPKEEDPPLADQD